jgi:hypothetical protein
MKNKTLLSAGLLLTAGFLQSQEVVWARQYNYISNNNDPSHLAVSLKKDLAIAGAFYNNSKTMQGQFLLKLDSAGNVIWRDTLYNHTAASNQVEVGGLAFGKPDGGGTETLYMASNFADSLETSEGSYGSSGSNAILFKYDGLGNKEWHKLFNKARLYDLWVTASNDLMVLLSFTDTLQFFGQNFYPKGKSDLLFAKVNATGALVFGEQISGRDLRGIGVRSDAAGTISVAFIRIGQADTVSYRDSVLHDNYGSDHEAFLLKTHNNGQLFAFKEVFSHLEFGSVDVDMSTHGYMITALERVFKTTRTAFQTFDLSAGEVSTCDRSVTWHGSSDYRTADYGRVAATGTNAYWSLGYEEAPGDIHTPADDKRFMFLEKIDYQCNTLLIDSFAFSDISAECDIVTHLSGNVYITGEIPIAQSLKIGNVTLTNSDDYDQHNTIFVACFADKQNTTGITKQLNPVAIRCYPNPSAGLFYIEVDQMLAGCTYHVYNCNGQTVRKGRLSSGKMTLDMGQMPAGLYQVNIEQNVGKATARLLKE